MSEKKTRVRVQGGGPVVIEIGAPPPDHDEEADKVYDALQNLQRDTYEALARRMGSVSQLQFDLRIPEEPNLSGRSQLEHLCGMLVGHLMKLQKDGLGGNPDELLGDCLLLLLMMSRVGGVDLVKAANNRLDEQKETT